MHILNNHKTLEKILLITIILYPWFFHVFQGLYIPELGYWLVSYENFFSNPEVSQVTFYSWLTTFLGAIVDYFVGSLGVVGFKIANVFVLYLILYVVYKLLYTFTSKLYLLYFLLIAEIMVNSYQFINYYHLTTLFFIVASLFLYKGLTTNNSAYIFLSGIFLALNIFIRFPNILGIGFIIAIIYYHYGKETIDYKHLLKQIGLLLLAYIITIISVLLFMKVLGHYDLYIQKLTDLFHMAEGNSSHGKSKLIFEYLSLQFAALLSSLTLFILSLFLLFILKNITLNMVRFLSLIYITLYILMKLSETGYTKYLTLYSGIIGLIYIMLLWIAFHELKKRRAFGLIALLSFIMIEIIPFGSAALLHQAQFGLYLALPVSFIYLFEKKKLTLKFFSVDETQIKGLGGVIGFALIAHSLIAITIYHPPGLDNRRWTMIHTVDDPHLRANFMSGNRAIVLSELISKMNYYAKDFSYILTYGEISTVSYLSNLKPYINNTYPAFMPENKLQEELKYQQTRKSLPMVVRTTSKTTIKGWPTITFPIFPKHHKHGIIFEEFLKEHYYKSVWKNKFFEILIPKQKAK